jgi:hypothetical protein
MSKYTWNDVVIVREGADKKLRPGQTASIVRVRENAQRIGYKDEFPEGTVYLIEFPDGTAIEAHEDDLILVQ